MMPSGNRDTTVARGHRMRYAPSTPEIAPDAPINGTCAVGLNKMNEYAAITPHTR
jgi:hypothetical protein